MKEGVYNQEGGVQRQEEVKEIRGYKVWSKEVLEYSSEKSKEVRGIGVIVVREYKVCELCRGSGSIFDVSAGALPQTPPGASPRTPVESI